MTTVATVQTTEIMGVLVLACRVFFATGPRDLAFIRCLRPTKRVGAGCVPYLDCEKAHIPPICDRPGRHERQTGPAMDMGQQRSGWGVRGH